MDTLRMIRSKDEIIEISEHSIVDNASAGHVTVELQKHKSDNKILVFTDHSEEIIDVVLRQIEPKESGYLFFASELLIDPIMNRMVPHHRIATKDEIEELVDRKVDISKLPVLRMLDPIRRWHNFPERSIVAIDRHDGTKYFRRVS